METQIIDTEYGKLLGKVEIIPGVVSWTSFKGIPYAKPPIGKLRFKAPEAPDAWDGVRDATKHGNMCIQNDILLHQVVGDEDCLYLNVYTPTDNSSRKLPVMIFIHGGGYQYGSGNSDDIGPEYLLKKNLILVTINYRLGAFGFLSLHNEDIPGNAGLKDQVAAMKWVKKNIGNFGGDPNNITLFGQSAGSASTTFHLFSPLSAGLFTKVILQSGVCTNYRVADEDPVDMAFRLGKYLGNDAADEKELFNFLQSVPAAEFVTVPIGACVNMTKTYTDVLKQEMNFTYGPIVEKFVKPGESFLTETIEDLLSKGQFYDVPVIIGCTNGEGILFLHESFKNVQEINDDFSRFIPPSIRKALSSNELDDLSQKAKYFYFGNESFSEKTKVNMAHIRSDVLYNYWICDFANKIVQKFKNPVYFYVISYHSYLNAESILYNAYDLKLTCHGDELHYLFTSAANPTLENFSNDIGKMIDSLTQLWTNVAKYGNPTPQQETILQEIWGPMSINNFSYLSIGEVLENKENPFKERIEFWKDAHKKIVPK